ncbi:hypothetical protein BLS_008519 [Venturia inaequalis]|uniref:Phytanoyl-CoA dioxygenase family protein n=1 Tax=Venturia inaequalis TaxID=5025 RepID=A0A8H3U6B5_VENIN|nr:hypothetical protein BLS_008519 [Venturia inaequalis]RDI84020.1 hypothetical protein Vi05172_g5936 [Venturia inaequalis]
MAPAISTYGSCNPEEQSQLHNDFLLRQWNSKADIPCPDVPEVSRLDTKDYQTKGEEALVSDIIQSLKRSGGCIIRNMIPQKSLAQCEKEIRPYLNATEKADDEREDFVPSNTRMVTGLLSKSPAYAVTVAGSHIWHRVNDYFLTSTLKNAWHGNQSHTSVSKPQLTTTVTFSVRPGTTAQGLHRDDDIYHTWHPASKSHHQGRDTMVCLFVAGSECTRENGATRLVPGSHLWDYSVPPPENPDNIFAAEMEPGDVFMMLGGTYHGAGANTTTDQERLVYAAFATRGYLRQEENQYLANDLEKIKKLPVDLQLFAGFDVSKPYMGWVGDMEDPIERVLGGKSQNSAGDFW